MKLSVHEVCKYIYFVMMSLELSAATLIVCVGVFTFDLPLMIIGLAVGVAAPLLTTTFWWLVGGFEEGNTTVFTVYKRNKKR